MDGVYYTLQDFMLHTKGVTYIVMVIALISITAFWRFLADRDDD